jgi:two-component system sensor histidine kinase CpxA
MLGVRFSLFSKIMLWFFLNLVILGAILFLIFNFRFDSRSSSFFRSANRIEAVTRQIESETSEKTRIERDEILRRYSEQYGVEFFLFDNQGRQLGGRETTLPAEVFTEITRAEGNPQDRQNNSGAPRPLP